MKRIALLALLFVATPVAASPRLGLAVTRADGTACVRFRGGSLRPGEHLFFLLFSPPRVVDGELGVRQMSPPCAQVPQEGQAYVARLRYPIGDTDETAVAVLDPTARVEYGD